MSYPTARITSRQNGIAIIEVYPRAYYRQIHYILENDAEKWMKEKIDQIKLKAEIQKPYEHVVSNEDRWNGGYDSDEYEPEEPLPIDPLITEYDNLFLPENKNEEQNKDEKPQDEWTSVKRKYKLKTISYDPIMQTPSSS